jgi:hypothetical protein
MRVKDLAIKRIKDVSGDSDSVLFWILDSVVRQVAGPGSHQRESRQVGYQLGIVLSDGTDE